MWRVALLVCIIVFPVCTHAAVSFSEVAWMGSTDSANHEWIELHNDGTATDVSDWHLTDGASLNIALTGVIPANSYVVLERTSDAAAPGEAFLTYAGALVNTGATLSLINAEGSLVDRVSGGEDWQNIGGDNVTKETAQYTANGWVTAAPTPGRRITTEEVESAADNAALTKTTQTKSGGPLAESVAMEPVVLTLPDITLQLQIAAPKTAYVHQPISFSVDASGIGGHLIDSLQYEWNFGDGETASRKETEHMFQFPGTYVVTVYAGFKRQEQVARHTITVLPVALSLTTNSTGDVQVNNDSPYEIDVSGYRLVGEKTFTFALRTILLANQTITIPKQKLGKTTGMMVAVYDAEGDLLASQLPTQFQKSSPASVATAATVPGEYVSYTYPVSEVSVSDTPTTESSPTPEVVSVAEGKNQPAAVAAADAGGNYWPYVGLAVVLLLATIALYATPKRTEMV